MKKELAEMIVQRLQQNGHMAAFAGGCVRDMLMCREPKDFDVATNALPSQVEAIFTRTLSVGKAFGVIVVLEGDERVEVATLRSDGFYSDGRRPQSVNFVGSFKEDASRRDFTINAMFADPTTGEIFDFFGGREDLKQGLIRAVGDPDARIAEDKLRMLRALRFASRFGFAVEGSLLSAIRRNAKEIHAVSAERVRAEIEGILTSQNPLVGLDLLMGTGLMAEILPEIVMLNSKAGEQDCCWHPEGNAWVHTRLVLSHLGGSSFTVMLAGLLHDIGKPATQVRLEADRIANHKHAEVGADIAAGVCKRLKLSNAETNRITELVRLHMRMHFVEGMRPGKLIEILARPDIQDLITLQHADAMGTGRADREKSSRRDFLLQKLSETAKVICEPPLVNGDLLIEMSFKQGPLFRVIKERALFAQRENAFTDLESARKWVLDNFEQAQR